MLLENGNKEAVFDLSKLTAFEVTVPSTVDVTQDDTQGGTQGGTQGVTQGVTQDVTQGDTQGDTQGMYLIYGLKNRLKEILKIERQ